MTGGAWICATCQQPIRNPYDLLEKRLEYRTVKTQSRYRTRVIAHMCRACVDAERPVANVDVDQGQLL